ncbi:MAG: glutathione S-transferase C-terminal domain-containing protein [Pseudomonadota bacterium]
MYTITIGDKAYSSWSMRGWLMLAAFGLPFEEEVVPMYSDAFTAMAKARAPARSVPQLTWVEGGAKRRIWDTLAIAETLAERHPDAGLWPEASAKRRLARVLAAQMHAGFGTLRTAAPMNLHREDQPLTLPPQGLDEAVEQLEELWDTALNEGGGPWLAGPRFTVADAMAAPYVFRFSGYRLGSGRHANYMDRLTSHPAVRRWVTDAQADPRRLPQYETIA